MADIKFNLDQWRVWMDKLDFEKVAVRGIRAGAMRAIPVLHKATDVAPPSHEGGPRGVNNTGSFRRSWKTSSIAGGVSIFNDRPYAPVIEGGRRKGAPMPPQDAIARWAQRKLGVPRKEAKRMAYAMARAIKARGLKPRNILKDSIPDITKVIIKEIHHELRSEFSR